MNETRKQPKASRATLNRSNGKRTCAMAIRYAAKADRLAKEISDLRQNVVMLHALVSGYTNDEEKVWAPLLKAAESIQHELGSVPEEFGEAIAAARKLGYHEDNGAARERDITFNRKRAEPVEVGA